MQDKIKEHDRGIRLARTETSAVSEHAHNTEHKPLWDEVKFIDRDPYYYTRKVKEAIQMRLHPDNININYIVRQMKLSFYCYSPRWITTIFFKKCAEVF